MITFVSRYRIFLVIALLALSGALQAVWLRQLYVAQEKQLKDELEQLVGMTTQKNWYLSIAALETPQNDKRIRPVFLSPEWAQLRQAFDNMKNTALTSTMQIHSNGDSTSVWMHLSMKDRSEDKRRGDPHTSAPGVTNAQLRMRDSLSLQHINKELAEQLQKINIGPPVYYKLYDFNISNTRPVYSDLPANCVAAYSSKIYFYGLQNHYRYQLHLPRISLAIFYRMRYYLASSLLMLLLTGAAFYFILRLLRNIQLYADAKADFTRNMTHELKTPISTISLALESIHKYELVKDPATLKNYIDISLHELERLDMMVEKALNIQSKNILSFKTELYDVQTGLQQVINSMRLQLDDRSEIVYHPSAEPCFVDGDPVHLTNVFYNLIENAIKYTVNNLKMEIRCHCDREKVFISFRDNGPGIEQDYSKKIFEKFFRIPSVDNTHNVKGSGLGLFYVRQVLDAHGGIIKVSGEFGHGACFTIILIAAT